MIKAFQPTSLKTGTSNFFPHEPILNLYDLKQHDWFESYDNGELKMGRLL